MQSGYNIKEIRQLYNLTQEEFAVALDITRELVNKMEKGKTKVSKATSLRIEKFMQERKSESFSHEVNVLGQISSQQDNFNSSLPYYLQRRQQKTEKVSLLVPLVGIKAQAGYVKSYEQVDEYMDTLEKYSLPPGVKGEGAVWSYFEVDGDSMEPTFYAGDVILASMVHTEDWQEIKNFCVYVILTADSLLVKRIYRKSSTEWVLISDNEEAYPQRIISVADIKELWVLRRHITAKAPDPKEYTITV